MGDERTTLPLERLLNPPGSCFCDVDFTLKKPQCHACIGVFNHTILTFADYHMADCQFKCDNVWVNESCADCQCKHLRGR